MLQEIIVREIRGFSPNTRPQLRLSIEEQEFQNLKPYLNSALPHPPHF
jgi:hypothetical protein